MPNNSKAPSAISDCPVGLLLPRMTVAKAAPAKSLPQAASTPQSMGDSGGVSLDMTDDDGDFERLSLRIY